MKILESAKNIQSHLVELRREFHKYPELSGKEKETSQRILAELKAIGGFEITENVEGSYGIIAEIKGDTPGDTTVLRADMDALSIEEETGLPYASANKGVMHACGHDVHVTTLLGAARLLSEYRAEIKGTARLVFQPAEEMAPIGGSRTMIKGGALKDADHVYGMHVWPGLNTGVLGVRDSSMMAASDHFSVHFEGVSSHGAQPHKGADAMVAGAHFVTAAQSIVSRNVDPMESAVITLGVMRAGTRYNIVAGSCDIEGTCRTYTPEVRALCEQKVKQVAEGIGIAEGCKATVVWDHGYNPLVNDPGEAAYMRKKMAELFGEEMVTVPPQPAMTAEDFSFYLEDCSGAFGWFGTCPEGKTSPALHNCAYSPDEDALWRGSALLAQLVLGR